MKPPADHPTGPILGRDAELARLEGHLARLAAGAGGVVEVVGAAGIGKTTLLGHLRSSAIERGWTVLEGRATEFERSLPFGLFRGALGDAAVDGAAGLPEAARHATHAMLRGRLGAIAEQGPVVLLLDDVHWADAASADLLAALLHRRPDGPVLLAIGYRPHQAGTAVPSSVARAFATGLADRVEVGPLGADAAGALIGTGPSPAERHEIRTLCGGNPFYLRAVVAARAVSGPGGGAAPRAAPGALVPAVVAAALAGELDPLDPPARTLLEAAAIAGEPFDFDIACAVAELDQPAGARALDALLATDLIRPTDRPRRFAFRHPLIRHTVATGARGGWSLAAHGRAAVALAAAGARPAELAQHLEHSARHGDTEAIALLTAAGKEVAARAPASAARWFRAAWALVPEPERAGWQHLELHRAMVVALLGIGRFDDARAAVLELQATLPSDHPLAPLLTIGVALVESLGGRRQDARERLLAAVGASRPGSPDDVRFQIELAALAMVGGDHPEVLYRSGLARAGAAALGDDLLLAEGTALAALGSYLEGDLEAARALCDEASERMLAVDPAQLSAILRATLTLARAAWLMGRIDIASAQVERGLVAARGGTAPILAVQLLSSRALVLVVEGRLDAATAAAQAALEEAELMANSDSLLWAKLAVAAALEPVGDAQRAVEAARVAAAEAGSVGSHSLAAFAGHALARTLLACGAEHEVEHAVLSTHGGPDLPRLPVTLRARSYAILATAAARLSDLDAAGRWLACAHAAARAHEQDDSDLAVALATGEVARAGGDIAAAVAGAREALAIATHAGLPIEAIRARLLLGATLADDDQAEAAIAELRAAEAACAASGAARLQAVAVRELRRLGRRVTRAGRGGARDVSGVAALTQRQREVALLAAEGLTNRAIAERLFLSEKTVETHIAGAMAKLGVHSRRSLAPLLP